MGARVGGAAVGMPVGAAGGTPVGGSGRAEVGAPDDAGGGVSVGGSAASSARSLVEPVPARIAARLSARTPKRVEGPGRSAAVLVPLTGSAGDRRLLFTRRALDLRRQPGQIAFPGGMVDAGDPSALAAALREAREEIGLDPEAVEVLGALDEWRTIQGFRLIPFVGSVRPGASFSAGPEVEEIFEAPLAELLSPGVEQSEVRRPPSGAFGLPESEIRPIRMWRYRTGGAENPRDIWGLTGGLVRSVLDLLRE